MQAKNQKPYVTVNVRLETIAVLERLYPHLGTHTAQVHQAVADLERQRETNLMRPLRESCL